MITKEIAMNPPHCLYHETLTQNKAKSSFRGYVNGKCKTWKTRPNEFRLPMRHGLRCFFYITEFNAVEWFTFDIIELRIELGLERDCPLYILADKAEDTGKYVEEVEQIRIHLNQVEHAFIKLPVREDLQTILYTKSDG